MLGPVFRLALPRPTHSSRLFRNGTEAGMSTDFPACWSESTFVATHVRKERW